MIKHLNLSNFNVLKEFRLRNKIRARMKALDAQKAMISKFVKKLNSEQFSKDMKVLNGLMYLMDSNTVIGDDKIYKLVYWIFKRFPEKIEDHSMCIFNNYVPKFDMTYKNLDNMYIELDNAYCHEKPDIEAKIEEEKYYVRIYDGFKAELREKCLISRKIELTYRLFSELMYRKNQNWFLVFNTLTVTEKYINHVFEKDSTVWTDYVRRVDRAIGIKCHGSWRNAVIKRRNGQEFHRYFAVVEKGSERGRLHIHVLHMCKELPYGSIDPNNGIGVPYRRCVDSFRQYWNEYGFSKPVAVRFNNNDAYGKLGWRYPYEWDTQAKKYIPCKISNCGKLCNYIGKYLEKNYNDTGKEAFKWRTRMSRGLGQEIVKEVMKELTEKELILMMDYKANSRYKLFEKRFPVQMTRILATKEYVERKKKNTPDELWEALLELNVQESLWKRVKKMIRGTIESSVPNYGLSQTLRLVKEVGSSIDIKVRDVESRYKYNDLSIEGVSGSGVRC